MQYKISYTPFIVNNKQEFNASEFIIPESSFLQPIKINPKIAEEVIPKVKEPEDKSKDIILSNLTWAREKSKQSQVLSEKDNKQPFVTWEKVTEENWPIKESIDYDDIKERQKYAESAGNANAISKAGAKGLYQIMDATHNDYVKATGDHGDLFDPEHNTRVRDYYMKWLGNTNIIKSGAPSDKVKLARQLAAYNWGIGHLGKYLENKKLEGVDIDNSFDWISGLPKETQDYINFIMFKKGTGSRSEDAYRKYKMKLG